MSLGAVAPCLASNQTSSEKFTYQSPYEEVDWDSWEAIHSMSHQRDLGSESRRSSIHLCWSYIGDHIQFLNETSTSSNVAGRGCSVFGK